MKKATWSLAHDRQIAIGPKSVVMGIVNATPDSFSDGGRTERVEDAVKLALDLRAAGADIIDIGGESTRPDAEPVSALEEQRRVIPVVEALAHHRDVVVSIDTYRAETARLAVTAGAHIVNDIWGLQHDAGIARLSAETGCGLVAMHNGRDRDKLPDPIDDQLAYFRQTLEIARANGVPDETLVLDPGFGFAKDPAENLEIIARFGELLHLGYPMLVGTSRKRFLGHVTGRPVDQRDTATAVSCAILRLRGASIFRVHNVAACIDALRLADAILEMQSGFPAP
ncbi:dihydropteroate synthase [Mesorhizobium australicum]|uniref:Dihydropteroate synthase n=1 Tax=Mesorhizobium australicum TaxID=536018 RepID=A0A1X7PBB9_9HYPH|nr:dihydropteroate synthase [Mesorhizobium australicum]SMH48454.1 Dihydropteroate synthase [Mesorhizobium australicum]